MKETMMIKKIWENETKWSKMTTKQKVILVWFICSLLFLVICGETLWLALIGLANFGAASYGVANSLNLEEE